MSKQPNCNNQNCIKTTNEIRKISCIKFNFLTIAHFWNVWFFSVVFQTFHFSFIILVPFNIFNGRNIEKM